MAKKRQTRSKDRLPNEYRGTIDIAADSSVMGAAGSNLLITTGMLIGQGQSIVHKWWLLAACIQPEMDADLAVPAATALAHMQLALGDHTGDAEFLDYDDPQRIASMSECNTLTVEGANSNRWPMFFPLPYPKPILAKELTVTIATLADSLCWDSQTFGVTLWYLTDTVQSNEIAEMLASYGTV